MNDYLVLVTPELGCAYRWSREYNALETCPLNIDNTVSNAWSTIEEHAVGDEEVTFRGLEVTYSQVYRFVEKVLKPGGNHGL